ncbi:ribonuclease P [Candidatus Woesearchaeota archaeon]|nr:ribonuclease P [Candidatus Woesearchaeota archaeon]
MKRESAQKTALERVKHLFSEAEKAFRRDPKLADRYVHMARKIAMKANLKIPRNLQKKFCKHCYRFLVPGVNCRVRTKEQKLIYYCKHCKRYMRFPLK